MNEARASSALATADGVADSERRPEESPRVTEAAALPRTVSDPLAESLALLSRLLERPVSPTALVAGLPLVEGRLTPALCVRAASRAGLTARIVRRPLDDLCDMLVPCIVLLEDGGACVLLGRTADGYRVALPEAGGGESTIPRGRLRSRYLGHAVVARPRGGVHSR